MWAATSLFSELLCFAESREQLEAILAEHEYVLIKDDLIKLHGQLAQIKQLKLWQGEGLRPFPEEPVLFRGHKFDMMVPTFLSPTSLVYELDDQLWESDRWLVGRTLLVSAALKQMNPKHGQIYLTALLSKTPLGYQIEQNDRQFATCYATLEEAIEIPDLDLAKRMLLTRESFNGQRVHPI